METWVFWLIRKKEKYLRWWLVPPRITPFKWFSHCVCFFFPLSIQAQLTLEQYGFALRGSTYNANTTFSVANTTVLHKFMAG